MPYDEYEYRNWYSRENYDRITLLVPKGSRAKIQNAARAAGKTINRFLSDFIPRELMVERDYRGKRDKA